MLSLFKSLSNTVSRITKRRFARVTVAVLTTASPGWQTTKSAKSIPEIGSATSYEMAPVLPVTLGNRTECNGLISTIFAASPVFEELVFTATNFLGAIIQWECWRCAGQIYLVGNLANTFATHKSWLNLNRPPPRIWRSFGYRRLLSGFFRILWASPFVEQFRKKHHDCQLKNWDYNN